MWLFSICITTFFFTSRWNKNNNNAFKNSRAKKSTQCHDWAWVLPPPTASQRNSNIIWADPIARDIPDKIGCLEKMTCSKNRPHKYDVTTGVLRCRMTDCNCKTCVVYFQTSDYFKIINNRSETMKNVREIITTLSRSTRYQYFKQRGRWLICFR